MILSELAKDCGSPEKKSVRGLSSTTLGRRTESLSEHPCLGDLGGDKTLSECHNVDTIKAFTFLLYFHVLDIRDHSLALPCLG